MLNLSDIPKKRRANAERWIEIISGHNKSGLSVKQYCQEQKVNPSTFYYWLNCLKGKAAAPSSTIHKSKKRTVESNAKKLIALKLAPSLDIINPPKQGILCTLCLPNGYFLNVYDTSILPALLKGCT
jgi:transposase-like protein